MNAIVFELEVVGENYFGRGRSLGISAPIVTETTITNRLLNYMTFETPGPEEKKPPHVFTEVRSLPAGPSPHPRPTACHTNEKKLSKIILSKQISRAVGSCVPIKIAQY